MRRSWWTSSSPGARPASGVSTANCRRPIKLLVADHALPDLDTLAWAIPRHAQGARWPATAPATPCSCSPWRPGSMPVPGRETESSTAPWCRPRRSASSGGWPSPWSPDRVRRGARDRYLADVDPANTTTCGGAVSCSPQESASPSAVSPRGPGRPVAGNGTAVGGTTDAGQHLGRTERIDPAAALGLYLGWSHDPADRPDMSPSDSPLGSVSSTDPSRATFGDL